MYLNISVNINWISHHRRQNRRLLLLKKENQKLLDEHWEKVFCFLMKQEKIIFKSKLFSYLLNSTNFGTGAFEDD